MKVKRHPMTISARPSLEAFQLYAELEKRETARVRIMQPFALNPQDWPSGGYPIQRDIIIEADEACTALPFGCFIQCAGLTLFSVTSNGQGLPSVTFSAARGT